MSERSNQVKAIFLEAVEQHVPGEWSAFVERASAGDPQLRAEVEKLLRARVQLGSFHEEPQPAIEEPPIAEQPGATIGPYRLLEQLGEGGMGIVFLAEQTHPVVRKVALKLIKPGMDSRQVLARFEAERQALALMDHPSIARVLDAGVSDSGRPYFVMELVPGVPITKYCDEHHLTPRQRLELFVPVCHAVQHAHQKGIIHRDLKPSNVLVALYDDRPVPKVIDFGVAKAAGQQLSEESLHTGLGTVVGTFEYMSPEQASLAPVDVDTRSDIYSLGVLLYELLTGSPPFTRKELEKAGLLEMLRVIREQEPSKPSTKLSTAEGLPSLAADRGTEPARLTRLVRGELDWIVMKCLEKDRSRRYETANGFAMDLQRYLADEPVQACPPSHSYRLRKFVRRNRGAVLAGTLILTLLLSGIVGTTWGMLRAQRAREDEARQRAIAQDNERKAEAAAAKEKSATATAEAREAATQAILSFVEKRILSAARPKGREGGLGKAVTLRAAIEAALPFVTTSFPNDPVIEARLRTTLGSSFLYLGDAKRATDMLEKARAIYTERLGPDDIDTIRSVNALAQCYSAQGRVEETRQLQEASLPRLKAKLGPRDPEVLTAMSNLAVTYLESGKPSEAAKRHEETLELRKGVLGAAHADTHRSMHNLAMCYAALNKRDEALKLRETVLPLLKISIGADHPETLMAMNNLANSLDNAGRHKEALALHEAALALRTEVLGDTHPDTLQSMNNLSVTFANLRQFDRALALRERLVPLMTEARGPEHAETLRAMSNLAWSYCALDRHQDALSLFERTLAARRRTMPPGHRDTLLTIWGMATCLVNLDRGAEAVPIIDECIGLAAGKAVDWRLVPGVMDLRLRHFKKAQDANGCRATAEMWEKLNRTDAECLIRAARFRAAAAGALTGNATEAGEEANRAMAWLQKAIGAGFRDADRLKSNPDLAALRERDDFKKLLADLASPKK